MNRLTPQSWHQHQHQHQLIICSNNTLLDSSISSEETTAMATRLVMLVLLVILSFVSLASCAPPTRKRPHLQQKPKPFQLTVSPTSVTLYPGKKVTVKCRVKGTYSVMDWLDVGFFLLLEKDTVMPLSSGIPGVLIRSLAAEGRPGSRQRRIISRLTLHSEMYDILKAGDNYFCCKGVLFGNSTTSGYRYVDYFVVRKKPRRRDSAR